MHRSPYRTPTEDPPREAPAAEAVVDGDLLALFAFLWVAALVRVGLAIYSGERFGVALTLTAIAIGVLPLLAKEGVAGLVRRGRRRRTEASLRHPHSDGG